MKTRRRAPRRISARGLRKLQSSLAHMERAELIRTLEEREQVLQFKHPLVQETAYESLLKQDRKSLHRLIGEALERLYANRLDEHASMLARHFSQTDEHAKTLEYATRAGDLAAAKYAKSEAIMNYTLALGAAGALPFDAERMIYLYTRRGRLLEVMGSYAEAVQNYDELEAMTRATGDRRFELAALVARATLYDTFTSVRDPQEAYKLAMHALELSRSLGDPKTEARILWNLELHFVYGDSNPQRALEYAEQALALARQFGLKEQMAYVLNDMFYSTMLIHPVSHLQPLVAEAQQLWRELDNRPMLADAITNAVLVDVLNGDLRTALTHAEEAIGIGQMIGSSWAESYALMGIGDIYWRLGQPAQAIHTDRRAIELSEQVGFLAPQTLTRADLAWVYGELGALDRAIELAKQAVTFAQEHLPFFGQWAVISLVRLLIRAGDLAAAQHWMTQGPFPFDQVTGMNDAPPVQVPKILARAEYALAQGDSAQTEQLMDEALALMKARQVHLYVIDALYLKASALAEQGKHDQAGQALEAARTQTEAIGERWLLWKILAAMGGLLMQRRETEKASQLLTQARALIDEIAANTPDELRDSFLNLPDVRAIRP